ncbi:MAG: ATP-binding cassette domain-containing protein [Candidatus Auribacterota bacterium]|nr:ATP-binding cassette domain-containing protein [Candidatus Auribacterota bacterium]
MIKVEKVSFTYPTGTEALREVSIELPRGEILGILGESGSGKTSLLKCIGRFLKPRSGRITLEDRDIGDFTEPEFRRAVGVVFQELYLFPHLTVLGNMTLALRKVLKRGRGDAEREAKEMLSRLGIGALEESYPSQVSRGQAQRAAIARALLLSPEYLLLDEPTSALDVKTANDFGRWLVSLKDYTTCVIVTHDLRFAALVATSGVLLEEGAVRFKGGLDEIINSFGSE